MKRSEVFYIVLGRAIGLVVGLVIGFVMYYR